MLSYLEKFNNLPFDLRGKISEPAVMSAIGEIEKKYDISLATTIMRVMVKEIPVDDLEKYFGFEMQLEKSQAGELVKELKNKVLVSFTDYLGLKPEIQAAPVNNIIKLRPGTIPGGADFYFDTDDEEEVKSLAKKISGFVSETETKPDLADAKIKNIITRLNINFSSGELLNRFGQIINTYLKGIRNKIDAKSALIKPVDAGGLGIDETTADKILNAADEANKTVVAEKVNANQDSLKPALKELSGLVAEDLKAPVKEAVSQLANLNDITVSGARDVAYDFSKLKAPVEEKKEETAGPIKPRGFEFIDLTKLDSPAENKPDENFKKDKFITDLRQPAAVPDKAVNNLKTDIALDPILSDNFKVINAKRSGNADGKVKMEDVKFVPKLMGPVDELQVMDLTNFRRLSNDPSGAANKIIEKVNFLEEESFKQRLAGVKAWRQSPVNKLYLNLGQDSIILKKPVSVIIEERKSSGLEYLTKEEFEAIMSLNKELRY